MAHDDQGLAEADALLGPDVTIGTAPSSRGRVRAPDSMIVRGLVARMRGPGGYYNLGNAIGLVGGVSLAIWGAAGALNVAGAAAAVVAYLAGSASALALTLATLIFFWSGEVYHRAWAGPQPPDPVLNRRGDLLSAIGALALGVALALLGDPLLAATAGLMHAIGKLGSTLHAPDTRALPGWPDAWPDPFRSLVLLSRVPATLVAAGAFAEGLAEIGSEAAVPLILGPAVLLICNLLWAKADLLLFRPARAAPA